MNTAYAAQNYAAPAAPAVQQVAVPVTQTPVQIPVQAPQSLAPVVQSYQPAQFQQPQAFAPVQYAPIGGYPVAAPYGAYTVPNNDYFAQRYNVEAPQQQQQRTIDLSPETVEVVNAFGVEAPAKLNRYALALEEALVKQNALLQEANARNQAMETILTDPNQLSNYTVRYFTEVVPVESNYVDQQQQQQQQMTPEQYAQYQQQVLEQQYAQQQQALAAQQQQQQFNYQPQMPQIPVGAQGPQTIQNPNNYWDELRTVAQSRPSEAWRYLNQMPPEALGSKLFFVEN